MFSKINKAPFATIILSTVFSTSAAKPRVIHVHFIRADVNTANSSRKSLGRPTYVGLLIATIGATLIAAGGAAHSGPCTVQIAQLEQQFRHTTLSARSGPTAPQSVEAQLHHQPTPDGVQNAESKAKADAGAALQPSRQADADGNAIACATALDDAKLHWVIRLR
jgi:hypothetical protein